MGADQVSNLGALREERGVLATGPPGTSARYILHTVLATVNLVALSGEELKAALALYSGPPPITLRPKN